MCKKAIKMLVILANHRNAEPAKKKLSTPTKHEVGSFSQEECTDSSDRVYNDVGEGKTFEHGSDWDFSNIYETECIILASEASQKKITIIRYGENNHWTPSPTHPSNIHTRPHL